MSARMSRKWWAIGLRGAAALLFAVAILSLPPQAIAPLVFLFAAYLAADGAFAILAGMRATSVGISLAAADPRGLRQHRSRRSRLAGDRRRCAGPGRYRLGRYHRGAAARSGT
jgi:hypothetical protein